MASDDSYISYFTPGQMSPETLEFIFVKRQPLAARIEERVAQSVLGPVKQQTLLLGPRGMGKSHLVALLNYRVKARGDLQEKLVMAWLAEEEWGVASLADFFLIVLRVLAAEYPDSDLDARIADVRRLPGREIESAAGKLIRDFVGEQRTLFLLMENLEEIFRGLGPDGQKALRAYLDETKFVTILATTPVLFAGIRKPTDAFYGFFQPIYLDELTADEATELLGKLAEHRGDESLAAFLKTPVAKERVQAVNDLAGGHPRVYLLFAHLLTQPRLDELVTPFLELLDELTPYYQSRMQLLTPQQRKLVEFLCVSQGAIQVKVIAEQTLLDQRVVAAQLGELEKIGLVRKIPVGRESYYELREPLMRMVIELKRSHNREPLRLVVDFLRRWYSRTERQERLASATENAPLTRLYLEYSLDLNRAILDRPDIDRANALSPEFWECTSNNDFVRAAEVAAEIIERRASAATASDWFILGHCLFIARRYDEALASYDKVLEIDPLDADGWYNQGNALFSIEHYDEALVSYDKALEIDPLNASAWDNRGSTLFRMGHYDQALASCDKALEINPQLANAWGNRGSALFRMGSYDEALVSYDKVLEISPQLANVWTNRGSVLLKMGRDDQALASFDKVLEIDPLDADGWDNRGRALFSIGRYDETLASCDKALEINPQLASAWGNRGIALFSMGHYDEALASFDKSLEINPQLAATWFNRGELFLRRLDWDAFYQTVAHGFSVADTTDLRRGDTKAYSEILLTVSLENESEKLALLVELYTANGALPHLGQGITKSIPALFGEGISQERAEAWLAAWRVASADGAKLNIPLRLLTTAVMWKARPDVRVLLTLPAEERRILEELLRQAGNTFDSTLPSTEG